jgi:hypothetical protein
LNWPCATRKAETCARTMYVTGVSTIEEIETDQSTFCKVLVVPGLRLARQSSAMMVALQQACEWLRLLLLIITAAHLRPINKEVSGASKRKRNDELDASNGGNGLPRRSRQGRSLLCFLIPKSVNLATAKR